MMMALTPLQDIKSVWALLATLLAGEGGVGVTRPLRQTTAVPYFYRQVGGVTSYAAPTDELVKSGPGILRSIYLNNNLAHAATAGQLDITIYDNTAASGNILWKGRVTSVVGAAAVGPHELFVLNIEREFTIGIFIDYSAWGGTQPTLGSAELSLQVE